MFNLTQKKAKKNDSTTLFLSLSNTPIHNHREHNVLGATQASFLAKLKITDNIYGQKRNSPQCLKDIMRSAIYNKSSKD